MPGTENADSMSFWDRLDVLRVALMKIVIVIIVLYEVRSYCETIKRLI